MDTLNVHRIFLCNGGKKRARGGNICVVDSTSFPSADPIARRKPHVVYEVFGRREEEEEEEEKGSSERWWKKKLFRLECRLKD